MKIKLLELFQIKVDLRNPYQLSKVLGTRLETQAIILKIHTEDGIIGFGEANPSRLVGGESPESVTATIHHYFSPILIGSNALDLAQLELAMDRVIFGNYAAKASVSTALHDIYAKAHGIPVYALLGGKLHSSLPVMWPLSSGAPSDDIKAIEQKLDHGYQTFMLKMGAQEIGTDIQRVKAIRKQYGNEIRIIIDVNQGWTYNETISFINSTEEYRIDLMEQPFLIPGVEDFRRIRRISPCPISADESLSSIQDAKTLIDNQAVDVFSLKISKNGGISKTKKIALLAEMSGINCLMNSEIEFGVNQAALLHLGATLRNLVDLGHAYMSPLRLADDITDYSHLVDNGMVCVPDAPGLGVRIDEEKLKAYTYKYTKID